MKTKNTSQQTLVDGATETINACLAQLQEELAGLGLDILAKNSKALGKVTYEQLSGPPTPFIETIDALHEVTALTPTVLAQKLKSKASGAEDIWAITNGFLSKLTSTKGADPVLCFEVTDRCTGRTVPVALPAMHYNILTNDVSKFIRELKKFRKEIMNGRGGR